MKKGEHNFAHQTWITLTPLTSKTPLDLLVDVIFGLSTCISLHDKMQVFLTVQEHQVAAATLKGNLTSLLSDLDAQAKDCDSLFTRSSLAAGNSQDFFPSLEIYQPDTLPWCLRAMHSAAHVILHSLMQSIDPSEECQDQAIVHSAGVASAVDSIDRCTGSRASKIFVSTVFSLAVVAAWSPSFVHRSEARKRLGSG